jgi:SAM-dependent methyltransferase
VTTPYYRPDLALVHHRGFGFHADACAPGILELLEPVRERSGVVLELGCGSGHLTRHLVDAGHRVIATDGAPAMVELTRQNVPGAEEIALLVLPDDPLPAADAVVSVGHVLSYLPDEESVQRGLVASARALRPDGVLALDLCDLAWGVDRKEAPPYARVGDDWAIISETSLPAPNLFVRQMATFLRNDDGTWRRDDERHDNVLIDTSLVPALLAAEGVEASVEDRFGDHPLFPGLVAMIGRKQDAPATAG